MITSLLPYLQTFLAIGNLAIMLYALKTFLAKPHDTLETRVRELEIRVDGDEVKMVDMQKSLDSAHEKHRQQHDTNEMFITCMLAFIDFEIAFCQHTEYEDTDDLYRAKETLQKYLARK